MYDFCNTCPYYDENIDPVRGNGPVNARYMVIGDYPSKQDHRTREPFSNISGQLLKSAFDLLGIKDVFYTTYCQCRPIESTSKSIDLDSVAVTACRGNILEEIERVKPKAIILTGDNACREFLPVENCTLNNSSNLGVWSEKFNCNMIAIEHPSKCMAVADTFMDILMGIYKIRQLTENGGRFRDTTDWIMSNPDVHMVLATTVAMAIEGLATLTDIDDDEWLAIDIETTGLDYLSHKPILVGIGTATRVLIIPHEIMLQPLVQKAFQRLIDHMREYTVGHNARFDSQFLLHHYGINWLWDFDTMLGHYVLNEVVGTHGLKKLARNELNAGDYSTNISDAFREGKAASIPVETLAIYLMYDVIYTSMLAHIFYAQLAKQPDMMKIWSDIIKPADYMFRDVEMIGVPLDIPYLKDLETEYDGILTELNREAVKIAAKYGMPNINIQSPQQIAKLLYGVLQNPLPPASHPDEEQKPSTDKDALALIKKGTDFVDILSEYRQYQKLQSTYVHGLLKRQHNGKVHPEFLLHGTVTGRLSCKNPNLQNIPQVVGPVIRDAFIAPEGYTFINADYSQLELRVAAMLADDKNLIDAFLSGMDIHLYVASNAIFHKPPEEITKQERHKAKFVNFGIVYGRGAKSLAEGELNCPVAEAKRYIDSWYKQYSALKAWSENQLETARKVGYVTSTFGRKRRFSLITSKNRHEIQKQCINAPIQSTASDLCLTSMIRIFRELPHDIIQPLLPVHDSILLVVKEEYAEEYAEKVKAIMEDVPFDAPLPFLVDIKIGKRWGQL